MIERAIFLAMWATVGSSVLGLAGWNTILLSQPIDISPLPTSQRKAATEHTSVELQMVKLPTKTEFSQTITRPLFSPTRREFTINANPASMNANQSVAPAAEEKPSQLPAITVQGIRVIGSERRALVYIKGAEHSEWLPVGSKIGDWTLSTIDESGNILLTTLGQSVRLQLWQK